MRDKKLEQEFFELLDFLISNETKQKKKIRLQIFMHEARQSDDVFQDFQEELEALI
jgi:septum formation topological specificity factor MinE